MSTVVTPGPVSLGHISTLLDGAPIRAVGPDDDGNVHIDAPGVGEERLRQAITDHDPTWAPPPAAVVEPTTEERVAALEARLEAVAAKADEASVTAQEVAAAARPSRT